MMKEFAWFMAAIVSLTLWIIFLDFVRRIFE
jgi:hypothetical protein